MKRIYPYLFCWSLLFSTVAFGQQSLSITLRIQDEEQNTAYKNEPVLISLSITNKAAQYAAHWNRGADRRLQELQELLRLKKINQEEFDRETKDLDSNKMKIPAFAIGSSSLTWYSMIEWNIVSRQNNQTIAPSVVHYLPNPASEPVAVMDELGYYLVYFGIDGGVLPPGNYDITASINNNKGSNYLKIANSPMNEKTAGEETLLRAGLYYWHAGDAEKALNSVNEVLKKSPENPGGLTQRGDIYVLQKKYAEALKDYQAALDLYYRHAGTYSEPPEYLLKMVEFAKARL